MTSYPAPTTDLRRFVLLRSELGQLLGASMLFSFALVCFRVFYTGSTVFLFLVWNLFLACIPYALSTLITNRPAWTLPLKIAASLVWLLFLPNAFYILTDLYHLYDRHHPAIPEWFDLALIFSCAWNGLLLGTLSLRQMEKYFRLPAFPIMALNALGIYAGRYLRYNSWDILSSPFQLAADIANMLLHPFRNHYAWDMIGCYTILLTFIYTMMKKLGRALN